MATLNDAFKDFRKALTGPRPQGGGIPGLSMVGKVAAQPFIGLTKLATVGVKTVRRHPYVAGIMAAGAGVYAIAGMTRNAAENATQEALMEQATAPVYPPMGYQQAPVTYKNNPEIGAADMAAMEAKLAANPKAAFGDRAPVATPEAGRAESLAAQKAAADASAAISG